jgi:hypothetical protein
MNVYEEQVSSKIEGFFSPSDSQSVTPDLREKIRHAAEEFSRATGDRLTDLYATLIRQDGAIELKDLWLFSERYIMLIEDFDKTSDSFKFYSAKKKITQVRITTHKYSFEGENDEVSDDSLLGLTFVTRDNLQICREAHGQYCPKLAKVIRLWVLPNLV